MKYVRFPVMMLMALVVGGVGARVAAAQQSDERLPAAIPPLVRTMDLDIGCWIVEVQDSVSDVAQPAWRGRPALASRDHPGLALRDEPDAQRRSAP
ncbi:MAG: hypothetical protein FJ280_29505, partial [Planctomycetes bacterium]|nr:hypothetical protein [Planctomycetota bacterium]